MTEHNETPTPETPKGKYLLVNLIARRVRALQSGSKALVARHDNDLLATAVDEFQQGKILSRLKGAGKDTDASASDAAR